MPQHKDYDPNKLHPSAHPPKAFMRPETSRMAEIADFKRESTGGGKTSGSVRRKGKAWPTKK